MGGGVDGEGGSLCFAQAPINPILNKFAAQRCAMESESSRGRRAAVAMAMEGSGEQRRLDLLEKPRVHISRVRGVLQE